jgi:type I restriction enzyme, R subunit
VKLFGQILRLINILTAFDDFEGQEIITERDRQDYQSRYLDIHDLLVSWGTRRKRKYH